MNSSNILCVYLLVVALGAGFFIRAAMWQIYSGLYLLVAAYGTHFLYGHLLGESFHGCIYWLLHIALIFYMSLNMANPFRAVFISC